MTSYFRAISLGAALCAAMLWPQASLADEVREHHVEVEENDDGSVVREKETWHDSAGDDKVRVEERVETDEDGNVIRRREKRIEHDND